MRRARWPGVPMRFSMALQLRQGKYAGRGERGGRRAHASIIIPLQFERGCGEVKRPPRGKRKDFSNLERLLPAGKGKRVQTDPGTRFGVSWC